MATSPQHVGYEIDYSKVDEIEKWADDCLRKAYRPKDKIIETYVFAQTGRHLNQQEQEVFRSRFIARGWHVVTVSCVKSMCGKPREDSTTSDGYDLYITLSYDRATHTRPTRY